MLFLAHGVFPLLVGGFALLSFQQQGSNGHSLWCSAGQAMGNASFTSGIALRANNAYLSEPGVSLKLTLGQQTISRYFGELAEVCSKWAILSRRRLAAHMPC